MEYKRCIQITSGNSEIDLINEIHNIPICELNSDNWGFNGSARLKNYVKNEAIEAVSKRAIRISEERVLYLVHLYFDTNNNVISDISATFGFSDHQGLGIAEILRIQLSGMDGNSPTIVSEYNEL